jgi:hypothetical protein
MRRIGVLLLLGAFTLAGCAGEDGLRAQELLERAARAQDGLRSATFVADLTAQNSGQTFGMTVEGGGYFKGRRAGDMYFRLDVSGIPEAAGSLGVVVKRGRAYFSQGSGWNSLPMPSGASAAGTRPGAAEVSQAMASLVESVEEISVTQGKVFRGEPATFVTGRIDGARLLGSLAADLAKASGTSFAAPVPLDVLEPHLGDMTATLMLSDRTGLLLGAVISVELSGEPSKLQLIYRLTSTNEPIKLPRVAG